MNRRYLCFISVFILFLVFGPVFLSAQGTQADYERAFGLREKLTNLVQNMPERPAWIEKTSRFWYRKSIKGGFEFDVVDATTLQKNIAFDHERLATALASVLKEEVDPKKLPFMSIKFVHNEKSIEFDIGEWKYACDLITYTCKKVGPAERRRRRGGFTMWERGPAPQAVSEEAKASPDGKMEAFIKNYNVYIRSKDKKEEFPLSFDGSEGNYYTYASIVWSPDSKKLAAYRLQRGYHRVIQYVESSPDDQLQPKYHKMEYAKPGDALDIERPVLFLIDAKKQVNIDDSLFHNPFNISEPV